MFDKDILVLDVETTGLDPQRHQVIEVGAVRLDRETLETKRAFSSLVRFDASAFEIDPEAMAVHGITEKELENAPSARGVLHTLNHMLQDCYLAGWNVGWDDRMLRALWELALPYSPWPGDHHLLDIWTLYKVHAPRNGNHLSDAVKWFGGAPRQGHRALADAITEAEVLKMCAGMYCCNRYEFGMPYRDELPDSRCGVPTLSLKRPTLTPEETKAYVQSLDPFRSGRGRPGCLRTLIFTIGGSRKRISSPRHRDHFRRTLLGLRRGQRRFEF
jgi:DNA polymerase III epsilon subunit-like protein